MTQLVVDGALLHCSFGTGPCVFQATPHTVTGEGKNAGTIKDHTPANIPTFIMCTSGSNPAVAAALGAPQACSPQLPSDWTPGKPLILIQGTPTLDSGSTIQCVYGGVISVATPGESTINLFG